MDYCISDIHGYYGLFCRLLEKIKFSDGDVIYVCGDMVDKGTESVRLLKTLLYMPNAHCILGNHEYGFLAYYWAVMKNSPSDFGGVLADLAPTLLDVMGLPQPKEMTGKSLLVR